MAKRPRASRKRSAASSSSPAPPEPLVFFIDRSLGRKKVPDALRAAGAVVKILDEEFSHNTPDATWLQQVGRHGWVVLTKDQGIRYSEIERGQLIAAGVRCFVLVSRNVTGDDMAAIFVSALERIEALCQRHAGPLIARVFRDATVGMWLTGHRRPK